VEDAPTKDLLTSQFFTPDEIRQLLVHCRALGCRLGLQTAHGHLRRAEVRASAACCHMRCTAVLSWRALVTVSCALQV
jgi:hypothetical protein